MAKTKTLDSAKVKDIRTCICTYVTYINVHSWLNVAMCGGFNETGLIYTYIRS